MRKILQFILLLTLITCYGHVMAQERIISGTVTSEEDGSPLPGVSVLIKGTTKGTISDVNGLFKLSAQEGETLVFSFIGFSVLEKKVTDKSTHNVKMTPSSEQLNDVVVVGSRGEGRTKIETVAPVDVINVSEISVGMAQVDIAQMLVATAPSFSAVKSQGGDLNSHVDSPTLRGLAPNQMLVLINGKRRHSSALLTSNQTGTFGNAVDMSFIPASSIASVQILRDGAAAQYGSDAIAGVMDIILKENTGVLSGNLTMGATPNFGTPSFDNNYGGLTAGEKELQKEVPRDMDGETVQFDVNYGLDLGNDGFLNITGFVRQDKRAIRATVLDYERYLTYDGTYLNNERTDKNGNPMITNPELIEAMAKGSYNGYTPEQLSTNVGLLNARGLTQYDVSSYLGSPDVNIAGLSFNLGLPLRNDFNFYANGDIGFKYVEGFSCYYRSPSWTSRAGAQGLYPNGFRPLMMTNQSNTALTTGVEGKLGDFKIDVSNTFGRNAMDIRMKNTLNVTYGDASPTEMYLGNHSFTQNTTNIDVSRFLPDALSGINIAFGGEMRVEKYEIVKGQLESYSNSDAGTYEATSIDQPMVGPDGFPIENENSSPIVDSNGSPLLTQPYDGGTTVKNYSQGCQCFTGFGPNNEANAVRTVMGAYLDIEADITDKWLVEGATRYETFLDFGSVLTGKVATRYSILDNLAVRGSASTGFRAPSLQELNYSQTFTYFVNTIPADATVYTNNSTEARLLGVSLKEETSVNYSVGIASELFKGFTLTADAYMITVKDRIFLTDPFTAADAPVLEPLIGDGEAQFRINGGTISTKGLEIVSNYATQVGPGRLGLTLAATFRENKFEKATVPDLNTALTDEELAEKYVRRASIAQFETGTSSTKFIGTVTYNIGKFNFMVRPTFYGEVTSRQNDMSSIVDVNGAYDIYTETAPATGETAYADQTYSPEWVFDMGITYTVSPKLNLSVGGQNVFNNLPDVVRYENRDFGLYSDYQQGSRGAYYFTRLSFSF
ncbi:TonB-dependent receptor [Reichenbachiella agarivorans]|uniref:TonB-dependent receptor n=1 Tax=Reichenbachiella agarivorans TaxID=2979464 RepID=A0ABY6CQ75_9BACT|nr:TonB-dependent receptor [Reichenbachiella agarivorans]UXP32673.1 TonB-dependent receptor [Reichenbachiella agarivorans]